MTRSTDIKKLTGSVKIKGIQVGKGTSTLGNSTRTTITDFGQAWQISENMLWSFEPNCHDEAWHRTGDAERTAHKLHHIHYWTESTRGFEKIWIDRMVGMMVDSLHRLSGHHRSYLLLRRTDQYASDSSTKTWASFLSRNPTKSWKCTSVWSS